MQDYWWVWVLGAGFVVVGAIFMIKGIGLLTTRKPQHWIERTGTLVDWEKVGVGTNIGFLPVIEYGLPDGSLRRFTNSVSMDVGI